MNREVFDKILIEEGVNDSALRSDLWNTRPKDELSEERLRNATKQFLRVLPGLQVRQELNRALAREYGLDK